VALLLQVPAFSVQRRPLEVEAVLDCEETRVKLESDTRRGVEGDERARRPVRSRRRKLKEYWGVEAVDVV